VRPIVKRWVIVVLLVLSLATPWSVLQSLAWVSMLVKYSRQATLAQAVEMTFDGKHPCRLCRIVQQNQAHERQPQPKSNSASKDFLQLDLPPHAWAMLHPVVPRPEPEVLAVPAPRSYPPPLPPPRG
jgi:hypothetical protein